MKKLFYVSLAVTLSLTLSCSKDYDLSNADKNICIGGEQFVFPIGNSTRMVPDSILTLSSLKELERDDFGNFFFHYSGSFSQSISYKSFAERLKIPAQKFNVKEQSGTLPLLTDRELAFVPFPLMFSISDSDRCRFTYDLSSAKKEGLVRLDSALFKPAAFKIGATVSGSGISSFPGVGLSLVMGIPERFSVVDNRVQGNTLVCLTELSPSGKVDYEPVMFSKVDLSDSRDDFIYEDILSFESLSVIVPDAEAYKAIMGKLLKVNITITLEDEEGGSLVPAVVYCLIRRSGDSFSESIKISGVPDYMKDAILDLTNPLLGIKLTTNATIPVSVRADMASYQGGEVIAKSFAEMFTPFVGSPAMTVFKGYVLADEKPAEMGDYEYVKADLRSLVEEIPDRIEISVVPSTYIEGPDDQHLIYLNADTDIDMDYDFALPLSFGPDLMMEFRDTVTNMPERLGEVLTKCNVSIIGEASSTLPMDIVLQVNFLDADGHSLDMHSSEAVISGTSQGGTPSVTKYSVDVQKSAQAQKISSLELILGFRNGQSVSMTENDYIQLSLQASVPGGIEIGID